VERITVLPYNPEWPAQFVAEKARLADALGHLAHRIEHHGSTAVPGLAAKPIIDIQVSVSSLQPLDPFIVALSPLEYHHVPHADDDRCPFFHRPSTWPHTHHLHLVVSGGAEEARTLAFRDYLRSYPEAAAEYEQLKRRLSRDADAGTFAGREAYAAGKTAFVERVTRLALADRRRGGC